MNCLRFFYVHKPPYRKPIFCLLSHNCPIALGDPGDYPEEKETHRPTLGTLCSDAHRHSGTTSGTLRAPNGRFVFGKGPKIGASSLRRRPASHRTWYGVRMRRGRGDRSPVALSLGGFAFGSLPRAGFAFRLLRYGYGDELFECTILLQEYASSLLQNLFFDTLHFGFSE